MGSRTVNRAPPSGRFVAAMQPPCSSTIRLQIASPSPVPVSLVLTKGSKIRSPSSDGKAAPVVGNFNADAASRRRGLGGEGVGRGLWLVIHAHGDRAALRAGLQGVDEQVQQHLAHLPFVGLHRQIGCRKLCLDADAKLPRPGGKQADRLLDDIAELESAFFRLGRPCVIEEGLDRSVQTVDLLLDNREVAAPQAGGAVLLACPLDEHFHRGEGIAQLMGQARRKLPHGGQLFGTGSRAMAFMHPLDHRPDLVGELLQSRFQPPKTRIGEDRDRADDLFQLPRRVSYRDGQLDHRPLNTSGDAEASQESGHGPAHAQQEQSQAHAVGNPLAAPAGGRHQFLVQVAVLGGGTEDFFPGHVLNQVENRPALLLPAGDRG